MIDQLATVRGRVTEPNDWYCLVSAPQGSTPQLDCGASNKFGDTTTIVVGLDGTVIYDPAAQS